MAAGNATIRIRQGETLQKTVIINNLTTGSPVDLTGASARAQAYDEDTGNTLVDLDSGTPTPSIILGGVTGTVQLGPGLVGTKEITSVWEAKAYVWDLFVLVPSLGNVNLAFLEGAWIVQEAYTRPNQWATGQTVLTEALLVARRAQARRR